MSRTNELSHVHVDHNDETIQIMLSYAGFMNLSKIQNTLQGSIWCGNKLGQSTKAIKVTNKLYHQHSISKSKSQRIYENILSEQTILEYLTKQQTLPKSIVKHYDFFQSDNHYVEVMEHGGRSLFQFIIKAHKLITNGTIDICEWHKVTKVIFKQMIESIQYIHSKNICHFDISLENFLINDVEIHETKHAESNKTKIHFVTDNLQIKLCDFGLSECFGVNNECLSNKYCGKQNYQSPEINEKKRYFNAKKNDIWCVGICLFMITLGISPWIKAHKKDNMFMLIMDGHIEEILKIWNKTNYVNIDWLDLMQSFFQYEDDRISLKSINFHSWFG